MNKSLVSFIVILLSLSFAFFYVKPEYSLVQQRSTDLANLTRTSESSAKIKALIGETEKNLNRVEPADLARFDVFLPEVVDPIRFANNIQHIGLRSGILLGNIVVEEPAKDSQKTAASNSGLPSVLGGAARGIDNTFSLGSKVNQAQGTNLETGATGSAQGKNYVATKSSFTFTSTYEAFGKFLFDMERSLGLINVTALSFRPVTVAADAKKTKNVEPATPPMYQFTVSIETYSLR